jgi:3-amino-5-hydroxybenzoate synthase
MIEIRPNNWPIITEEDKQRIMDCVDSRRFWAGDGSYVSDLEKRFQDILEVKHCLAVCSGTAALETALSACGIGFGDEVLVPAFTFMSSASSVLKNYAIPIPVDVDPETFCLDISKAHDAVSQRTKAIMPVHMSGNSCAMTSIRKFATEHDLLVIEDCAHSIGSIYFDENDSIDSFGGNGKRHGSLGDFGCFSFQSSKLIVAGEGGLLSTNNTTLYEKALSYINYGWVPNGTPYGHFMPGTNLRMPELSAALAIGQLKYVTKLSKIRQESFSQLEDELSQFKRIFFQKRRNTIENGCFYFLIGLKDCSIAERDNIIQHLTECGVPCRRNYPPFHQTDLFIDPSNAHPKLAELISGVNYKSYSTPVSSCIGNSGFWIPHWAFLPDQYDWRSIVRGLKSFGLS